MGGLITNNFTGEKTMKRAIVLFLLACVLLTHSPLLSAMERREDSNDKLYFDDEDVGRKGLVLCVNRKIRVCPKSEIGKVDAPALGEWIDSKDFDQEMMVQCPEAEGDLRPLVRYEGDLQGGSSRVMEYDVDYFFLFNL